MYFFFISDNLFMGTKKIFSGVKNNFLVPTKQVIRRKQDLQGPPSGFDTKYLALADRNMQVRFGLKVV